jgi:hypothetical protein
MLTFETHGSIKKIYQGIKSKKQNAIKKIQSKINISKKK